MLQLQTPWGTPCSHEQQVGWDSPVPGGGSPEHAACCSGAAGGARLPVLAGSCRQESVRLAASLLAPGEDAVAGRRAPQAQVSTN